MMGSYKKGSYTKSCQSVLKLNKTLGTTFILTKKYQFGVP